MYVSNIFTSTDMQVHGDRQIRGAVLQPISGHLPGVDFSSSCTVTVTGSVQSQTILWEERGFRMHIPGGAVAENEKCEIVLATSQSGSFVFPDDTILVSSVYYVEPSRTFLKPVMLEIEHCCRADSDNLHSLAFARCSTKESPYEFQHLRGGTFSTRTSYGQIKLSNFSMCGILWFLRLLTSAAAPDRNYCFQVLYRPVRCYRWDILFIASLDLSDRKKVSLLFCVPVKMHV